MTERITAQIVGNDTIATINHDLSNLDNIQQQLSTGLRINEASDDPYGASLTLALKGQIAAYGSYTQNIGQGTSWAQTASAALNSVASVTQSVRELTVEAANGTMNAGNLSNAAQAVLSYIGQIKATADTQYDGSYIFSGTATGTQPWNPDGSGSDVYQGNSATISYAIGPGATQQISADLHSVLGDGVGPAGEFTAGAPGTGGLLATLRRVYDDLTGAGGGSQSDLGAQLSNLDDNLSALEDLQAQVGATEDSLSLASTRITALSTAATTQLGNVEDTDMAQATVTYSTDEAGYEAALQSAAQIIQTSLLNFLKS